MSEEDHKEQEKMQAKKPAVVSKLVGTRHRVLKQHSPRHTRSTPSSQ